MRKESIEDEFYCIICSHRTSFFTVSGCGHDNICLTCTYKSRTFYNNFKCPVCGQLNDDIVAFERDPEEHINIKDINKEDCYQDDNFEKNKIYYSDISAKEEILEMTKFKCPLEYCKDPVFDNLKSLLFHVKKAHKRYFCEICVSQGKKFLSDAILYNYDTLQHHYENGELDSNNTIISPVHPHCQFCNMFFFSDENLIAHMDKEHFECQLCRSQNKKLKYFKDVKSLFLHNKYEHYQCPYMECANDFFVAFESKIKVVDHLQTKHKCTQYTAEEKLTKYYNDKTDPFDRNKIITKYVDTCFNVEEHVKTLNTHMNDYIAKKKLFDSSNTNIVENDNKKFNKDFNKNDDVKKGRWNNNDNFRENTKKNKHDKTNMSHVKSTMADLPPKRSNVDMKNLRSKNYQSKPDQNNENTGKNEKNLNPVVMEKPILKIDDYTSFFTKYYKDIKPFIIEKIKSDEIQEDGVVIPVEVHYQLVVIIDKQTSKENSELKFITNFGFGFSLVDEILHCFTFTKGYDFKDTLSRIPFNKLLILYKFIHICFLKETGGFYKKDHDLIDEDIYDEFLPKKKVKKEKKPHKNSGFLYSTENKKKQSINNNTVNVNPANTKDNNNFGFTTISKKNKKIINPSEQRDIEKKVYEGYNKNINGNNNNRKDTEEINKIEENDTNEENLENYNFPTDNKLNNVFEEKKKEDEEFVAMDKLNSKIANSQYVQKTNDTKSNKLSNQFGAPEKTKKIEDKAPAVQDQGKKYVEPTVFKKSKLGNLLENENFLKQQKTKSKVDKKKAKFCMDDLPSL